MKKLFYLFVLLSVAMFSCKETNDLVQLSPPASDILVLDSTYNSSVAAQPKNVLLEDYTGDRCDNCPTAQAISVSIEDANPGRVAVIGLHCTSLAAPYPGYPDYRTDNGTKLMNYFFGGSGPSSLPTGMVDRKLFNVPPSISIGDGSWTGFADSELTLTPIVNVAFTSKNYNPTTRTLSMEITSGFIQASSDTFYISAALIESGFKGVQETPSNFDSNFVFKHVLRKLMNPYNGLQIAPSPKSGANFRVKLTTILDPSWNADSCKVIAFVHHRSPHNNYVEQVQQTTVK